MKIIVQTAMARAVATYIYTHRYMPIYIWMYVCG